MNNTSAMELSNQMLDKLSTAYGQGEAMNVLAKMAGYEEAPPTIDQFIRDPEFFGPSLVDPSDGSLRLYPVWQSALSEIYPNPYYSPYIEIVLTGSIGIGKSTVSLVGSGYDICKLTYLKHPQRFFNLLDSTIIEYSFLNATKALSFGVLMSQFLEMLENSPYFKRLMNQQPRFNKRSIFPKGINVGSGSRSSDVLGKATVGAILSELNFQTKVGNQAKDNFDAIMRRMKSRFEDAGGTVPGHVWMDSSKTDVNSFIEDYINTSIEVGSTSIRVFDYPVWVVKAHTGKYSKKTFKVFIGDQSRDPFILEKPLDAVGIDDSKIIDVPMNLMKEFKSDIHKSLQDIAGVSCQALFKFIPSMEKINQCLARPNPVHSVEIKLDFFDRAEKLLKFVDLDKILNESKPRFIHIDIGITGDRLGLASTGMAGLLTQTKLHPVTMEKYYIDEPVYVTDFVLFIKAKPGQEIPIYKIREFLIDLKSLGYPIEVVSTDGYQSTNLRQDLLINGIKSEYISVDRTKDPYNKLKQAILEGRYHGVDNPILRKEFEELIEFPSKIDHPSKAGASKDGADAIAGSVWNLFQHMTTSNPNIGMTEVNSTLDSLLQANNLYEKYLNTSRLSIGD